MNAASAFLSALILGVCCSATASTYELLPTATEVSLPAVLHSPGTFIDRYNFNILNAPGSSNGSIFFDLNSKFNPGNAPDYSFARLTAGLFRGTGEAILADADVTGFAFELASGSYFALVSGATSGRFGGQYQVNYALKNGALSPVPLPAAFWLFGAALVGFYQVGKRRAQGVDSASPSVVSREAILRLS
jgi:hypothetical protein